MSVKAVLCKQYGPPETLVVEELPSPRAGPGEAVVSVKAASVNFPDVLIIQNKYQFKPPLPFSPGSELAGVVKEVGAGVSSVRPGDRVMAFTTYGAFAEEVKTEAARLLPIPEGMDFKSAAAFVLTYGTSDHALRDRGALRAGVPLHRLARTAAGGRLRRRRDPQAAAEPRAPQGRFGGGRVLGRLRAPRAGGLRRQHRSARPVVPRGEAPPACLENISA